MTIEPVAAADRSHLLAIAVGTGLFSAEEAEALLGGVLDSLASAALPAGHAAVCCRPHVGEPALAWAYYAPDQHADAVWNIWWIGVQPASQGLGAGRGLLHHIEARVAAQGARLVVIETSATAGLARARRFYASQGYAECGRVPDFYAEGDDKVVFARRPRPSP